LAEFERELIRARTGEGRERAEANGVKMGRKPKLTDHHKREAIQRRSERGDACRDRPQLQRVRLDDFEVDAMNKPKD
jgi:DNA invertase Pin-like site-specific DNA recombinase